MAIEVSNLEATQIDLWFCSIDCLDIPSHSNELLSLLNGDELRRYQRFIFDKDKNVFLASRYLLRTLLSSYYPQVKPKAWTFEFNDNGKPSVSKGLIPSSIHFNISHSRNNVALAFSKESGVGVDLESYIRDSDLTKLANYSFSAKELEQIQALQGEAFRDRFFSLWTLKEAYMKADGRGMTLPLKSFSFIFDQENRLLSEFESDHIKSSEHWLFWQYETELESFISLALRSGIKDREGVCIKLRELTALDQCQDRELPLRKLARP